MLPPLSRVLNLPVFPAELFSIFDYLHYTRSWHDLRFSRIETGHVDCRPHVSSDSVRTSRLFFNREYLCRIVFDQYAFLCIFLLYCHQEIPQASFYSYCL